MHTVFQAVLVIYELVLVAWEVLFEQHTPSPSKVFCLGPCNEFQSATDELAAAIIDWTSSSKMLRNSEDDKMLKRPQRQRRTF